MLAEKRKQSNLRFTVEGGLARAMTVSDFSEWEIVQCEPGGKQLYPGLALCTAFPGKPVHHSSQDFALLVLCLTEFPDSLKDGSCA